MGPPQLCFPLGLGDVMQIKQFICDFSVCKQIVMACLSNRRCCKLDFSVGKLMTSAVSALSKQAGVWRAS